jgi:hypothetical protein
MKNLWRDDYNYYGAMDSPKPTADVKYMMIDEHIYKIIDKNKAWFEEMLEKMTRKFKKDAESNIVLIKRDMKSLSNKVDALIKANVKSKKFDNSEADPLSRVDDED